MNDYLTHCPGGALATAGDRGGRSRPATAQLGATDRRHRNACRWRSTWEHDGIVMKRCNSRALPCGHGRLGDGRGRHQLFSERLSPETESAAKRCARFATWSSNRPTRGPSRRGYGQGAGRNSLPVLRPPRNARPRPWGHAAVLAHCAPTAGSRYGGQHQSGSRRRRAVDRTRGR